MRKTPRILLYILLKRIQKKKVQLLSKETYLAMIQNSLKSKLWRNSYALVHGERVDITDNGNYSCAFFVSSILKLFDLVIKIHWTVQGLEQDLLVSGWKSIPVSPNMPKGSILIWEKQGGHLHAGFYIGEKKAISIWTSDNWPVIRDWQFNGKRKIVKAYSNIDFLGKYE